MKKGFNCNCELFGKEYEFLDKIFNSNDKEAVLNEYLSKRYDAHSDYAWYNYHLRKTDTYCGYWSFESAAVAKILKLDNGKIYNLDYYPVL